MKKTLLSVFILLLVVVKILGESNMTEDIFTVGERAEVKVSISYESESFEIDVTISNISENTLVLVDTYFERNFCWYFENAYEDRGEYVLKGIHEYIDQPFSDYLAFLEPDESVHYTRTYEYYLDNSLREVIDTTTPFGDIIGFKKDDQIYWVIRYNILSTTIEAMKDLTNEYLLDSFEKKYLVELPEIDTEEKFSEGNFEYTIENGNVTITNYTGSNANLIIPEKLGGYEVRNIGYSAFRENRSLTAVTIPDSATSIDDSAFEGCTGLKKIEIPDSVTSIGESAFAGCTGLKEIEILDSVISIGHRAFLNCTSLTAVEIPDSVISIGSSAFENCESLTSIKIGNSITSLGYKNFSGCKSLTAIEIPDSVTSIGWYAFENCTNLASVTIGDSVTHIVKGAFLGCISLTDIKIPDSVTSIGSRAFSDCKSLTSLKIPSSVTSMGWDTFENSNRITLIIVENSYAHEYAMENDIDYVLE